MRWSRHLYFQQSSRQYMEYKHQPLWNKATHIQNRKLKDSQREQNEFLATERFRWAIMTKQRGDRVNDKNWAKGSFSLWSCLKTRQISVRTEKNRLYGSRNCMIGVFQVCTVTLIGSIVPSITRTALSPPCTRAKNADQHKYVTGNSDWHDT